MSPPVVSILGSTGFVGKFLTPVLIEALAEGKFKELRVLVSSKKVENELVQSYWKAGAKIIPVDYSSVSSLTSGLKSSDVVLSALGTGEGMEPIWNNLLDALETAKIPVYFPSEYDSNLEKPPCSEFSHPMWEMKKKHYEEAKKRGLNPVKMISGPILEYIFVPFMGFDCANHKWTLVEGAENVPCNVTSQRDIGKFTVEAVLLAHQDRKKCPDYFEIYSEVRPLKKYAEELDKVSGKKTVIETVPYAEIEEKYKKTNGFEEMCMLLFAKGAFDFSKSPANEILNQGQKKWKLTKFEEYAEATGGVPRPDSIPV